jgi:hypothetical protein
MLERGLDGRDPVVLRFLEVGDEFSPPPVKKVAGAAEYRRIIAASSIGATSRSLVPARYCAAQRVRSSCAVAATCRSSGDDSGASW